MHKLLVANRGEIAVRIMRSAKAMGIATVAVYSDADADALHVRSADEAVRIGPAPVRLSYLDAERVLEAAAKTGSDALHPGYGFLAENAAFARRCGETGMTFVGPPPAAIALMGDKVQAKRCMIDAGVPTAPGYHGDAQGDEHLQGEARTLGVPLLVKATAGGGGRGMRIVRSFADLPEAVRGARSEARHAFGNGDLFLERLIEGARHVEIQVFCDTHGNAMHLGERECSVQRRHQKVIEEAPSVAVTPALREAMGQAAIVAATTIGYVGAGTVEFLLDDDGRFYFLEMNTRLQVEHPVTEMITGHDVVAWQLRVAQGEPLPVTNFREVVLRGHAIEARLYAEDPWQGFLPQAGNVLLWVAPSGEGVRVDSGIATGQTVSSDYDPMLTKIIAHGDTRELARRRLGAALRETTLLGFPTNREFLLEILGSEAFIAGAIKTSDVDAQWVEPTPLPEPEPLQWALAAVLLGRGEHVAAAGTAAREPWHSGGIPGWPVTLCCGDVTRYIRVVPQGSPPDTWVVEIDATAVALRLHADTDPSSLVLEADGVRRRVRWVKGGGTVHLHALGRVLVFEEQDRAVRARPDEVTSGGRITAPIGGRVVALNVEVGDLMEAGRLVAVIEAMKMEHRVTATGVGRVEAVHVAAGDQVAARQAMVTLSVEASEPGNEG